MEPTTIHYLATIEEQETFLQNIVKKYDHIYVSIGGKFNEPTLSLQKVRHYPTNAQYQLIPEFLRNSTDQQHLILVLDEFTNQESIDINCRILKNNRTSSMDIAIFNTHISINGPVSGSLSIDSIIESILDLAKKMDISPKNTMFCNYIVFCNPNQIEYKLEESLPVTIQQIFDRPPNKEYAECFYQWYGATFYFYNLVYQYKKYCTMRLIFISELLHLCDIMKYSQPICKEDICNMIENITSSDINQKQKYLLRKLQLFNANNIDITFPVY